jgi:hypothetical protein
MPECSVRVKAAIRMTAIQIGTCEARPGQMTLSYLEAMTHFD